MLLKNNLKQKELVYPLVFIGINFIFLLVEYIRFGEFYSSMSEGGSQFFKIFYSNRPALISAISIYISSIVVIITLMLKSAYFLVKVFILSTYGGKPKPGDPPWVKPTRSKVVSKVSIMVLFLVFAFVYWLFDWFLQIMQGIDLGNKILIFLIVFINSVLVLRLKDNILILVKSLIVLLGTMFVVSILTLVISWDIVNFHNYIAAFGILLLEAGTYVYIFLKVKSTLDEEFVSEQQKNSLSISD